MAYKNKRGKEIMDNLKAKRAPNKIESLLNAMHPSVAIDGHVQESIPPQEALKQLQNRINRDSLKKRYDKIINSINDMTISEEMLKKIVSDNTEHLFRVVNEDDPSAPTYELLQYSEIRKVTKGQLLYRAVKNVNYTGRPPEEKVRYGRLNEEGENVFYLAFSENTARLETDETNFVNTYRAKRDFHIVNAHQDWLSNSPYHFDQVVGSNVSSFYNDLFSISRLENEEITRRVYIVTNQLKNNIFNNINIEDESVQPPIGFLYPSVQLKGESTSLFNDGRYSDNANLTIEVNDFENQLVDIGDYLEIKNECGEYENI